MNDFGQLYAEFLSKALVALFLFGIGVGIVVVLLGYALYWFFSHLAVSWV